MTDQIYTVVFDGRAGDEIDVIVQRAISAAGGEVLGCGTFLMSNPTRRDIEFSVPADHAEPLINELRLLGLSPQAKVH